MSKIETPEELWPRDSVAVAVETIEHAGEVVPLSGSYATVENRRVTSTVFVQVAWGQHAPPGRPRPTEAELERACTGAGTLRRLTRADLDGGVSPETFVEWFEGSLSIAAKNSLVIATHDLATLGTLIAFVDRWRGIELPPVFAVSTAVLERARMEGNRPRAGESHVEFYRRMEALGGAAPDLRRCRQDHHWEDGLLTQDRLYPVLTTMVLYQNHWGGRMFRSPGSTIMPGNRGTRDSDGRGRRRRRG